MDIKQIHDLMTNLALKFGMNQTYADDLIRDYEALNSFEKCDFVWLLRENGSIAIPIEIGVDDSYITHWLYSTPKSVKCIYHISLKEGSMRMIDFEKAEKLANLPPANFPALISQSSIHEIVSKVLAYGCEKGIWGAFRSPSTPESIGSWNDWLDYFRSSGNRVMISFMANAIRKFNR